MSCMRSCVVVIPPNATILRMHTEYLSSRFTPIARSTTSARRSSAVFRVRRGGRTPAAFLPAAVFRQASGFVGRVSAYPRSASCAATSLAVSGSIPRAAATSAAVHSGSKAACLRKKRTDSGEGFRFASAEGRIGVMVAGFGLVSGIGSSGLAAFGPILLHALGQRFACGCGHAFAWRRRRRRGKRGQGIFRRSSATEFGNVGRRGRAQGIFRRSSAALYGSLESFKRAVESVALGDE